MTTTIKKTTELMMDNVIRKYGFEAKETIFFCELVERFLDPKQRRSFDTLGLIRYFYKQITLGKEV